MVARHLQQVHPHSFRTKSISFEPSPRVCRWTHKLNSFLNEFGRALSLNSQYLRYYQRSSFLRFDWKIWWKLAFCYFPPCRLNVRSIKTILIYFPIFIFYVTVMRIVSKKYLQHFLLKNLPAIVIICNSKDMINVLKFQEFNRKIRASLNVFMPYVDKPFFVFQIMYTNLFLTTRTQHVYISTLHVSLILCFINTLQKFVLHQFSCCSVYFKFHHQCSISK